MQKGERRSLQRIVYASALVVLFYLLEYWRYKWKLLKDPALRSALGDERVNLGRLKTYRFAFFTLVVKIFPGTASGMKRRVSPKIPRPAA
jgi:hypothetical protein